MKTNERPARVRTRGWEASREAWGQVLNPEFTNQDLTPGSLAPAGIALAVLVVAATCITSACGAPPTGTQPATATPTSPTLTAGLAVTCGPSQQAFVRPQLINGQQVTVVECAGGTVGPVSAVPLRASWAPPAGVEFEATASPAPMPRVRPASYGAESNVVTYVPRARRPQRSVQKSLLIIGSSAGVGAGLGAAIGGKKGALIGAAIGGGGATIWDQATRRR